LQICCAKYFCGAMVSNTGSLSTANAWDKAEKGLLHDGIAHLTSRTVKVHGGMTLKEHLLQPFNLKERMQNAGREEYFALAHVLNEEIMQPGRLVLAEDKEDMEMVELIKSVADDLEIRGVTVLDRKGIEELQPIVNPKFIGGLFDPNESVILPMPWANAFAENAEQNGNATQDCRERTGRVCRTRANDHR
jgi:L-2-hydroxyglutarate oxidase LhgO